jgi:outer membrane protein assembly factor BamE (lipoprotein component of BamABCDE complex)
MNKNLYGLASVRLLLLLAMGVAFGCSTAGAKFDTNNVQKIVKGTTSKNDVRRYFGDPLRTENSPNGEVWTYSYVDTHTTAAGVVGHVTIGVDQSQSTVDTLTIVFDGEVVKDFRLDSGSHTDTYKR